MAVNQPIEHPHGVFLLDDLTMVGPDKPMGYLVEEDIINCGASVVSLKRQLEKRGLVVKIYERVKMIAKGPVIFVYDKAALEHLLKENEDILKAAGWPITAEEFVCNVGNKEAKFGTALYNLIAKAFGGKEDLPVIAEKSLIDRVRDWVKDIINAGSGG